MALNLLIYGGDDLLHTAWIHDLQAMHKSAYALLRISSEAPFRLANTLADCAIAPAWRDRSATVAGPKKRDALV